MCVYVVDDRGKERQMNQDSFGRSKARPDMRIASIKKQQSKSENDFERWFHPALNPGGISPILAHLPPKLKSFRRNEVIFPTQFYNQKKWIDMAFDYIDYRGACLF